MKIDDIHAGIAIELLGASPGEDDALALMILMHTHRLRLRHALLEDRPGVTELAAITQRGAAAAIAAAWPNRSDVQRTDYRHWYWAFNTRTPYEILSDVPADWMLRMDRMKERVARSPLIEGLEEED